MIPCECGSVIQKGSLRKHLVSNKHLISINFDDSVECFCGAMVKLSEWDKHYTTAKHIYYATQETVNYMEDNNIDQKEIDELIRKNLSKMI